MSRSRFGQLRQAETCRLRRRGSIYAMVLGVTMLITVIGIGSLMASRVTTRGVGGAVDWEDAGFIAYSAVEHAIAKLNSDGAASPDTWRNAYTSGVVAFTQNFRNGRMRWMLVDEDDGVFNDDTNDAIRLYGVGTVGTTTRVYSVQLKPAGDGVTALRTAFHSAGGIDLSATTIVLGGPISTNGNLKNADKLVGGAGTEVAGTGGTSSPAKPLPAPGVFDLYKAKATTIPSSNASSGTLSPGTLSATNNPYGSQNADGIYYLRLPGGVSKLTISACRVKGTLLIENAAGVTGQELTIEAPGFWEPGSSGFATLITRGVQKVTIDGSSSAYSDGAGVELSELRGLFHCIGTTDVTFKDRSFLRGCWIADGEIKTNTNSGFVATPSLVTAPPYGYDRGNKLTPVPGSWRWDAPPAGL